MSAQVKIIQEINAGPSPRTIVGLLEQGPRLIGFNTSKQRLADQIRFGLELDVVHLELLARLANDNGDSDEQLLEAVCRDLDVAPEGLQKFTRRFRGAAKADNALESSWRPPVYLAGADESSVSAPDPLGAERLLAVRVPLLFRLSTSGFEHVNHAGRVDLCLSARELSSLRYLTTLTTVAEFAQRGSEGGERLPSEEVRPLLERLMAARLLRSFEPGDPAIEAVFQTNVESKLKAERISRALFDAIARAEERNPHRPGTIPVLPVNLDWALPPLALGYLFTVARQYKHGRLNDSYDFRPRWLTDSSASVPDGPIILLHSHYVWNSAQMLACAARARTANPLALNVHGGPDVPKYEADVESYFRDHPYIDIAVHGEGEVTICEILEALEPTYLKGGPLDLSVLDGVRGLTYRGVDGLPVRTADRSRIVNLDDIPSPYLTGEFDVFAEAGSPHMLVESNRGCPYGCTFCDWGSATASKIRKFDLDRIYAEIEWGARNKVEDITFADANFGVFDRDVEIAQRIVDLKKTHGFPAHMGTNYAKNSVKNLKPIIETLVEGGILAMGLLSLQSMDEDTLSVINRANIKLAKYEALAGEFRANNLPLYVDLMMGLPGANIESFRNDLQECIDREVFPKIFPTQLLVNSPMNDPSYREKYGITAAPAEIVTSCVSFSEADYKEMTKVRRIFLVAINFGTLRHALRYARQETGQREIDLLDRLIAAADNNGDRWPALRFTLLYVPHLMVPPVDWGWFLADVHRFFVEQLGIADDAALDSALRAQHAMLPAPERRFPETIELSCDYASWYQDVQAARESGHYKDWFNFVPPLRAYGQGTLTVTDPKEICARRLGKNFNEGGGWATWELDSEIARPSAGAL